MRIEDLGLWNPWWEDEKAFMKYYDYSFLAFREIGYQSTQYFVGQDK